MKNATLLVKMRRNSGIRNDSIAPLHRSVKSNGQHLKAKFDRAEVMATLQTGEAVPVRVSGRRFQRHPLRSMLLMRVIPPLFRLGVNPDALARLYRRW